MKTNVILFLVFAALVVSCSQQEELLSSRFDNQESANNYHRSLNKALKEADAHFNLVFGEKTRGTARKVSSIEYINPSTRSNGKKASYYVVNYKDNQGFSLLSADKRQDAVFAISDRGELHLSDTIYNKGLAYYINSIENISLDDSETKGGYSGPIVMDTTIQQLPLDKITWVIHPIFPDRMDDPSLFLIRFHQGAPYNKYCFTPEGIQAPAGCAPIAAGLIMSYYEWPKEYKGHTFDWASMKNDKDHDSWAQLFAITGKEMKSQYTDSVTNTGYFDLRIGLGYMGFKDFVLTTFTKDDANSELRKNKPLLMAGHHYGTSTQPKEGGHIWVIDGGYNIIKGVALETDPVGTDYYRCIWGWGGQANGYYKFTQSPVNSSISPSNGLVFKDLMFIKNLNIKN